MKELRATEGLPEEVRNTLIQVIHSLGSRPEEVSQEGWSYNPKTGYFKFKAFLPDGEGGFVKDSLTGLRVTVKKVRKLKPFWRKRLEGVFKLYKDEHAPQEPR